jgi:2-polyprenyl-3-methyl-5-hydroxy-6-metoxy-1,4-benzoquinol methylase
MYSKQSQKISRKHSAAEQTPSEEFNRGYYQSNKQEGDRIALGFYYKLASSYVKSGKILDYGCGTGHLIKRFQERYESWAYDSSPYATESSRLIAPHAQICSDIQSIMDKSFNLILSIHVLEHLREPMETMHLFNTLLVDNGILFFVVPNVSGLGHTLKKQRWSGYRDPSHVSLMAAKQWLEWTKLAGFHILQTGTDGLWDVPYLRYIPLWIQKILFYPMPALQVIAGRLIWPYQWGESLIVIARKKR